MRERDINLNESEKRIIHIALEDVEDYRLDDLKEFAERLGDSVEYIKENIGEFHIHEALDRCHIFQEQVNTYLTNHPAILTSEKHYRLAVLAESFLFSLYQQIAKDHLDGN